MSKSTKVKIGKTEWKNPVTTGSGTFGSGLSMTDYVDLNRLGAITIKGTTLAPCPGNIPPRMIETRSAVLGSVGLENPGVDAVLKDIIPKVALYDSVLVVNIGGNSVEEYGEVAARLNTSPDVDAIEINISCPNLKKGGLGFGTDPEMAGSVISTVRKNTNKTVIAKLTPAVTDITVMAKTAQENGADALTLSNGYPGLAISTKTRKPILGNVQGGICGPSLKPLNMLHVWKASQAVKIPIIALGGIMNADDAIEYILAGATGVSIGTANLIDPTTTMKVVDGIERYLEESEFHDINDLIGLAWKQR